MTSLIHIPKIYGLVTFFLLCIGSQRLLSFFPSKLRILQGSNLLYLLLICFASFFLSIKSLLTFHGSFVLGPFLGLFLLMLETKWNRLLYRNKFLSREKLSPSSMTVTNPRMSGLYSHKNKEKMRVDRYSPLPIDFRLTDVCLAAILEEILFRGFLFVLTPPLFFPIYSIFFGAIHLFYGWNQFFAKTMMGIILSLTVIFTHNLYPAILAHLFFNIEAYRRRS